MSDYFEAHVFKCHVGQYHVGKSKPRVISPEVKLVVRLRETQLVGAVGTILRDIGLVLQGDRRRRRRGHRGLEQRRRQRRGRRRGQQSGAEARIHD